MRAGALDWLLSGDTPRSRPLSALCFATLVILAVVPFVFPQTRSIAVGARICVFIVLACSYDILIGYTGIASFAHAMFFGIGAYGTGIMLAKAWVGWGAVLIGGSAAVVLSVVLAIFIGLLSLRMRAIFFSMVTLAIASLFLIMTTQLRNITGGEDGLDFSLPFQLTREFVLSEDRFLGARLDGRFVSYYLTFAVAVGLFLLMLRIVNSPFGRVLQAIRENEFRAEALGFRTVLYRSVGSAVAAGIAAIAGVMMALLLGYNGADATFSFDIMVDVLLMVVIGGMGTLYGPALGAVIIVMAQYYLQPLMGALHDALEGWPLLPHIVDPDRWILWLGVMFVLIVYFFPSGIAGRLREAASTARRAKVTATDLATRPAVSPDSPV
jgi:branched-chain amino acid transport system permease protein